MAGQIPNSLALSEVKIDTSQHRATKLLLKIVQAYHIRQYIFPHLTATEAARLIHATKIDNLIGQQERHKVLNPMRDLFTDDELGEINLQLASNPNHHVLVVGRDLEVLYARVADPTKINSGIPLLLSAVETTMHKVREGTPFSTSGPGRVGRSHWWRAESTSDLPGTWSTCHQNVHIGMFNPSRQNCEVSEEKIDIRDKRIRLRRRRLAYSSNTRGGCNVFENLTNKGLMTMLKGNVQQSLGKANRLLTVMGPDRNGLLAPVLDKVVFVDMRNPVLKLAINSSKTRSDCLPREHILGLNIAIPSDHERDCWYIPLGFDAETDTKMVLPMTSA